MSKFRFSDPWPMDAGGHDWEALLRATNEGYYASTPKHLRPPEMRYDIQPLTAAERAISVPFQPVEGTEFLFDTLTEPGAAGANSAPSGKPQDTDLSAGGDANSSACPHAAPLKRLYADVAICFECGAQFQVESFSP